MRRSRSRSLYHANVWDGEQNQFEQETLQHLAVSAIRQGGCHGPMRRSRSRPVHHANVWDGEQNQFEQETLQLLAPGAIKQGAFSRKSLWRPYPPPAQLTPSWDTCPTGTLINSTGQQTTPTHMNSQPAPTHVTLQPVPGEMRVVSTWPPQPQSLPIATYPAIYVSNISQFGPIAEAGSTLTKGTASGPSCLTELRARNVRGYLKSAAHLLPPRLWSYKCRLCGLVKKSCSTLQNSTDSLVRIRCPCGGKRLDGETRMHSEWTLVDSVESS